MPDHDPLCPLKASLEKPYGIAMSMCKCDLIGRVREDERTQVKAKEGKI